MICASFADVHKAPEIVFYEYLSRMPDDIVKDVLKYRNKDDKYNSLFGKVLLNELAEKKWSKQKLLQEFSVSNFGKPYLSSGELFFNISHSGNYVISVVSDEGPVGIDIEKKTTICYDDFKRVMTDSEWSELQITANKKDYFFNLWAKKEATIKANGRGLSLDLKKIIITGNTAIIEDDNDCFESWILHPINVNPGYSGYIASQKTANIYYEEFNFDDVAVELC